VPWHKAGLEACYGDASDPDFIAALPLASARWVVSAVPAPPGGVAHEDHRLALLDALRAQGFAGRVAVTALRRAERAALQARGADLVLLPFSDAADRAAEELAAPRVGVRDG
jgi:hypothetical protein